MALTKLEEILEDNLDYQFVEQGAIPSIKDCCRIYAQSQTQELQEHNDNLANNLLEMSNSLVGLIKENNNLKDLSNTITGLQLQDQNAELVDSLSKLVLLLEEIDSTLFHHNHSIDGWHLNGDLEPIMNFVNDMDLEPIAKAKEILTKHNHLNKKP